MYQALNLNMKFRKEYTILQRIKITNNEQRSRNSIEL